MLSCFEEKWSPEIWSAYPFRWGRSPPVWSACSDSVFLTRGITSSGFLFCVVSQRSSIALDIVGLLYFFFFFGVHLRSTMAVCWNSCILVFGHAAISRFHRVSTWYRIVWSCLKWCGWDRRWRSREREIYLLTSWTREMLWWSLLTLSILLFPFFPFVLREWCWTLKQYFCIFSSSSFSGICIGAVSATAYTASPLYGESLSPPLRFFF